MKNLLIYTSPAKKFDAEAAILVKIQIDNSLNLGWQRSDLMLVTNFKYQYQGLNSIVIPDGLYYDFDKTANKIIGVVYLLNQGLIQSRELYWCHDFDAYENSRINEEALELDQFDMGLTHYFYKPEWQLGSFFFKDSAKDILELLDYHLPAKYHSSRNDEKVLTKLINHGAIDPKRYKRLNVTYNIMKRCLMTIFNEAEKPLKVVHFHPWDKDELMSASALNIFMYGQNRLKMPLMSDRLIQVFHHHGIK